MKRFTQYLYEYQKEKRIRNIGFVKVEQREDDCVLQIQGRGLTVRPEEKIKIYLFYRADEVCEAVYQGAVSKKQPILNCTLEFTKEDIGNAKFIDEILGVMLQEPGGKRYAAVWNGEALNVDEICTEMRKKEEVPMQTEPEAEEVLQEQEENLEEYEIYEDLEPEESNSYEKIQRKDLARLPRKDWKLANNNFLLHGFYNYHHLLWIEENGELYIGVPGVNHARELQAAQAFGFTEFRQLSDMNLELSEEETNPREDFGYFCRRITRNE